MLIQDLLQRRNSKRSTAQHIWSMQSEDFCSSVARYRRAAAATDSATPRPLHPDRLLCSKIWLIFFLSWLLATHLQWRPKSTQQQTYLKFIYSAKATKFCEIFTFLLTVCTVVKSKVKISQNFVAFSEYMNLIKKHLALSNLVKFKTQEMDFYKLLSFWF